MTAATFVGANAGVTGNNASLAPTIHASAVAGDLMLLFATIRNTSAAVNVPAGWGSFFVDGNVALLYREHSGTESAPTVTFSGGAAGDDTLAQIGVVRTVAAATTGVFTGLSNVSAQNITLPGALTPNRDGSLVLVLGWKQDDWTSVATLAGMTEIGETIATAGNDAAMVWDYRIDTTAAATPAGPFTVTGGASAVSKSYLISLAQKAAISVTPQDVYPPRNLVSVTNLIVGDQVSVYRVVGGERTLLRAGSTLSAIDTAFLVIDAELPFGVPVSYVGTVNGFDYATASATYDLPGGEVALSDAISGDAAEVLILAWPEKSYERPSTIFKVAGRNIVDVGDMAQFEATITLYTEAQSAREQVQELLAGATEGVLQIRSGDATTYDGVNCYVVVTGYRERRYSQDGSDKRRMLDLDVAEVDGWAPGLAASGFTYVDLEAAYTGLTYATLASDYATYLALAQADLG